MTKLTMTLAAAALMLGSMAIGASAQTHQLGSGLQAQIQNATPIVHPTACGGFGPRCGPGFTWVCGYYGRCWCRPC
jgi:hypothetical protein